MEYEAKNADMNHSIIPFLVLDYISTIGTQQR